MTGDSGMIELERFYLMTLASMAKGEKYDTVLQQIKPGAGRLWLIPERKPATTVPDLCVNFAFELESVRFEIQFRDEHKQKLLRQVKYAEGLDAFLQDFDRAMKAGRLAAPKAA